MNSPPTDAPLRILLLEDDSNDRELVLAALRRAGLDCQVECVTDKTGFEQAIERGQFELILSDFTLPGFDGLAALSLAQEKCPAVPYIFVSGTIGEERAIETLQLGASDLVLKDRLERLGPAVRRALGIASERAKRLRAEEALRRTEERFRALVEQSIVGIYLIQDDHFTYVNPQMTEIFGVPGQELCARPVFDFVCPEDRELVRENIRKRLQGVVPSIRYVLRVPHSSGEARFVEVHGSRIEYESRAAIMGTMLDITARKQAEDQWHATNQQLQHLLELRTQRAAELERFHRLSVGREWQMIELKKEINELARQAGEAERYDLSFLDNGPEAVRRLQTISPGNGGVET